MRNIVVLLLTLLILKNVEGGKVMCRSKNTLENAPGAVDCIDSKICKVSCKDLLQDTSCGTASLDFEIAKFFENSTKEVYDRSFDQVCLQKKYSDKNVLLSLLEKSQIKNTTDLYKYLSLEIKALYVRQWCALNHGTEAASNRLKDIENELNSTEAKQWRDSINKDPIIQSSYLTIKNNLMTNWTINTNDHCVCEHFVIHFKQEVDSIDKEIEVLLDQVRVSTDTKPELVKKIDELRKKKERDQQLLSQGELIRVAAKASCIEQYKNIGCGNLLTFKLKNNREEAKLDLEKTKFLLSDFQKQKRLEEDRLTVYEGQLAKEEKELAAKQLIEDRELKLLLSGEEGVPPAKIREIKEPVIAVRKNVETITGLVKTTRQNIVDLQSKVESHTIMMNREIENKTRVYQSLLDKYESQRREVLLEISILKAKLSQTTLERDKELYQLIQKREKRKNELNSLIDELTKKIELLKIENEPKPQLVNTESKKLNDLLEAKRVYESELKAKTILNVNVDQTVVKTLSDLTTNIGKLQSVINKANEDISKQRQMEEELIKLRNENDKLRKESDEGVLGVNFELKTNLEMEQIKKKLDETERFLYNLK